MKSFKSKKGKETPKVIHDAMEGTIGKLIATIAHNNNTDRYDFRIDSRLNLSGSHADCLHRANEHEVVWS